MSWLELLAAGLGGGGLAGIVTSLLAGLLQRPKVKADAVALLTDAALKQVNELQERTAEAERAATEARKQMRLLTAEADAVVVTLRSWRAAILSPVADLEMLRQMVRSEPERLNGHRM